MADTPPGQAGAAASVRQPIMLRLPGRPSSQGPSAGTTSAAGGKTPSRGAGEAAPSSALQVGADGLADTASTPGSPHDAMDLDSVGGGGDATAAAADDIDGRTRRDATASTTSSAVGTPASTHTRGTRSIKLRSLPTTVQPLEKRGRMTRTKSSNTAALGPAAHARSPGPMAETDITSVALKNARPMTQALVQSGRAAAAASRLSSSASAASAATKADTGKGALQSKRRKLSKRDRASRPARQSQVFVSCLDYPKEVDLNANVAGSGLEAMEAMRAQRKSKVDALGRIDGTATTPATATAPIQSGPARIGTSGLVPNATSHKTASVSPGPQAKPVLPSTDGPARPANNPIMKAQNLPLAPALDMDSVRTSAPRHSLPRTEPRMFDLPECPTFYPSEEEFQDPMEYIRKIGEAGNAKKWGMCKIVPPEGWTMPFVLDTQTFRFKTRLQRLNSLEASSRAKVNFLQQLQMFHSQQGNPSASIPIIDRAPLDVWSLRKEVQQLGGAAQITAKKRWGEVARAIGYTAVQAHQLKTAYAKIIGPFDEFQDHVKGVPPTPVAAPDASKTTLAAKKSPGALKIPKPANGVGKKLTRQSAASAHAPENGVAETSRAGSPASVASFNGQPPSTLGFHIEPAVAPSSRAGSVAAGAEGLKAEVLDGELMADGRSRGSSASEADVDLGLQTVEDALGGADTAPRARLGPPTMMSGMKRKREEAEAVPNTPPKKTNLPKSVKKGDACEVCLGGNNASKIILCDDCDAGYHIWCLDPPLEKVPDNDEWFCPECLLGTGNDFGFDEGEEHSLFSFQQRASAFRQEWFTEHASTRNRHLDPATGAVDTSAMSLDGRPNGMVQNIGGVDISEHDVEKEFWRLVEAQNETVEVEYGADVHSTTHGSGAPTMETFPTMPSSTDSWNLNNMPILPKSLLRYIKSDISGMTVPWIYVGMLFAAFCWHNEDHYTYSVNYMYWGDTKTWYGVSGDDADNFEKAIKSEAPELFEQQPSLLFQLVTMMNPGRLRQRGVNVSACDQRPGEFVVTFPKAYHCGFNHGLNYNEAVNFALPDWLDHGRECVERYKQHAKPPVFSHDELLVSIAEHSDAISTAIWLKKGFTAMVDRELEKRSAFCGEYLDISVIIDTNDHPEDQYTCAFCKGLCYLSQVICECKQTNVIACLDHARDVCTCSIASRTLRLRFRDEDLIVMGRQVEERANMPSAWQARFTAVLMESARPPLKTLRQLLADGERMGLDMPELRPLRKMVDIANDWVEKANWFFTRKITARARVRRRDVDGDDVMEAADAGFSEVDRQEKSIADVEDLLDSVSRIGFDSNEISRLRDLRKECQDFQEQSCNLLQLPEDEVALERAEALAIQGGTFNVETPELRDIRNLVGRLKWVKEMNEIDEHFLELKDVVEYLEQADTFHVDPNHEFYVNLSGKRARGEEWLRQADAVLAATAADAAPSVTLNQLDKLLEVDGEIPPTAETQIRIKTLKQRAGHAQTICRTQLSKSGDATSMAQARKTLKSAEKSTAGVIIPELQELAGEVAKHDKWLVEASRALELEGGDPEDRLGDILVDLSRLLSPGDEKATDPAQKPPPPTDQGDEELVVRYSCVCRRSPDPQMVKCRKCRELYHPECINMSPVEIEQADRWKCPYCRSKDRTGGRGQWPKVDALVGLMDDARWTFRFPFPGVEYVKEIIDMILRSVRTILFGLKLGGPGDSTIQCTDRVFLRHWLKKLRTIPLEIVVNKATTSYALYPVLDRRLRSVVKHNVEGAGTAKIGPVAPKFELGARVAFKDPDVFNCICRTPPTDALIQVRCKTCSQRFHQSCVAAPDAALGVDGEAWQCPACAFEHGQTYLHGEVVLQLIDHVGSNVFINVEATKKIVNVLATHLLAAPAGRRIILYVIKFTPGIRAEDVGKTSAPPTHREGRPSNGHATPARPAPSASPATSKTNGVTTSSLVRRPSRPRSITHASPVNGQARPSAAHAPVAQTSAARSGPAPAVSMPMVPPRTSLTPADMRPAPVLSPAAPSVWTGGHYIPQQPSATRAYFNDAPIPPIAGYVASPHYALPQQGALPPVPILAVGAHMSPIASATPPLAVRPSQSPSAPSIPRASSSTPRFLDLTKTMVIPPFRPKQGASPQTVPAHSAPGPHPAA